MLEGLNKPLEIQLQVFIEILKTNKKLMSLLRILENYAQTKPNFKNYYVAAGCINETIFNYYHHFSPDYGISDYDIVYFDEDLSYEAEDIIIKDLTELTKDLNITTDIKNQARVHIWYSKKTGKQDKICTSCEDSIASWGTTITCLGVRLENSNFIVVAPYGFNDLYAMILRPIKDRITKEGYLEKTTKWCSKWPKLKVNKW